jgi:hypothetical protein
MLTGRKLQRCNNKMQVAALRSQKAEEEEEEEEDPEPGQEEQEQEEQQAQKTVSSLARTG